MVRGLNKKIGLAWAQPSQMPRSLHEQIALFRDIGHSPRTFQVLNEQTIGPKPKNNNGYHNKDSNNTPEGTRGKQRSQGHISTDRKDRAVKLQGIHVNIISEGTKADMCRRCSTGPYKWFEYYAKNPVVTRTGLKK